MLGYVLNWKEDYMCCLTFTGARCRGVMHFRLRYFVALWITMTMRVQGDDNFVFDYFVYKRVPRVTIFSCEQTDNDFRFVRRMNELGISVGVGHPRAESYDVAHQVARKTNWAEGLLLDTRCQTPEVNGKLISQATKHRLYEAIHVWLIIAWDFDVAKQFLNDSSYSLLTDLVLAVGTANKGYVLYDVYNPCKTAGGTLNITKMGFWNPNIGFDITLTQDKFNRRSNLHGMKLKVGIVVKYQQPGTSIEDYLQDYTKKSEDPISKYGFTIVQHLADLYNFTIDIYLYDEWAAMDNGTERGLMVQLSKATIDLAASACSANVRYASYGHLSMPGYPYRTFFLLRSNFEKLKWTELWTPLAIDSWYAIGLATMLSVVIITTIQMTEYGEGWTAEFGHAMFAMVGVLCQQGLVFVPNRLAGRIALFFLLSFAVLLFNYYGASVVSARLSEPPDKMNDSLYSLAKSQIKIGSEPFFNIDDNLNSRSLSEWEVRYFNEKVWKKLPLSRYEKLEEGLRKVAMGQYAYHTSAEVAYPYVDTHWDDKAICEMTEIHVITPRVLSFYERTDSPFTEMTKIGLIKTTNVGLQSRAVKRWKPKIPYCSPLARSLQSISFFEMAPALILMMAGTAVALLIFQIERITYKMHRTESTKLRAPKVQRTGGKKTLLRH